MTFSKKIIETLERFLQGLQVNCLMCEENYCYSSYHPYKHHFLFLMIPSPHISSSRIPLFSALLIIFLILIPFFFSVSSLFVILIPFPPPPHPFSPISIFYFSPSFISSSNYNSSTVKGKVAAVWQ